MKAPACLLALLATACVTFAQTPVVIYQPQAPATVVSPLTNSTAQSGQALLSQINNTINQRVFEHQVLTIANQPVAPGYQYQSVRPIVILPK
jgi:hypothetical protein